MVQQSLTSSSSIHNPQFSSLPHSKEATQILMTKTRTEVLKAVQALELTIEICGSWLWVFGADGSHEAQLRDLGLNWSSRKGCWYWCPLTAQSRSPRHQSWSLDQIREKYGSQKVKA